MLMPKAATLAPRLSSNLATRSRILLSKRPRLLRFYQLLDRISVQQRLWVEEPEQAIEAIEKHSPSLLIVEQELLRGADWSDLRIRIGTTPSVRALMVTEDGSPENLISVMRMGFAGYLEPDCADEIVAQAIARVELGELWASRKIVSETLQAMISMTNESHFTAREEEILERIAAGQDNRSIAQELFITRETVRWHLRSAYAKLGVHDRTLAARL